MNDRRDMARVWLEVDLNTVRGNFRKIRAAAAPAQVLAVLKANAYGLGVRPIAECLAASGAAGFCAATLEEALELKTLGKPVMILGSVLGSELGEAVANGIILGIIDADSARKISAEAVRQGKTAEVHFKLDTGMGRLGILAKDAAGIIPAIRRLPNLDPAGIYTHFPSSERGENEENRAQIERFVKVIETLGRQRITFRKIHMANSDGINFLPPAHKPPFTHVRAGIDLHGSFSGGKDGLGLESVFTLKSRLLACRKMPAGSPIGYNSTCRLEKDTVLGTVTAGYADGLPLELSNRGSVLIRGRRCPVLGRISMDYTTVSLEAFGEELPEPGTEVTLIGRENGLEITTEDWTRLRGTHAYDILCSFGPRVKRFCIGREKQPKEEP
ncbi:MAG: alanine racemase [Lentisphaeria bacterium]|nr:alanine racemase [Lentisphaeria bacterium]